MLRNGITKEILLMLASCGDVMDAMTIQNQYRAMLGVRNYRKGTITSTIGKILSVGDIEKRVEKGRADYVLTSKGWGRLKESIPVLKFQNEKWDKLWRIIIFDISEERKNIRQALRSKLLSLGFGQWQKSVYVTPFPLEEEIKSYLEAQKLFPAAVCFTAKRTSLGNDKDLAYEIWKLGNINEKYYEIINEIRHLDINGEVKLTVNEIWNKYKETLEVDPHLPKELLPERWAAEEAKRLVFSTIKRHAIA